MAKAAVLVLCLVCMASSMSEATEEDRVLRLPGQPHVTFNQFAGYVNLDQKALFYWFFEADQNATFKPLVLWINGEFACSTVAAQVTNPFRIGTNGSLTMNKYAWNRAANLLLVESPVGVGFSYANDSTAYNKTGDTVTVQDSYLFLRGWFEKFPTFKSNDFYITGEAYAGHYGSMLSELILNKNKVSSPKDNIKLKGLMLGNANLNGVTDTAGKVDHAWTHGMISDKLHGELIRSCDHFASSYASDECLHYYNKFLETYGTDVHAVCNQLNYDERETVHAETYLNRKDVQEALHARLSYPYTACSKLITFWTDAPDNVLPIMKELLKEGIRIWLYSGSDDWKIPFKSTRLSVNKMNLSISEEWRAWAYNCQVAGWVESYHEGLTVATVRGAELHLPLSAPEVSLFLLEKFLSAQGLPFPKA